VKKTECLIKKLCVKKGLTLALAESCTGGLISSRLTDVPGSSGYFKAGIISYANDAKIQILGVPERTIQRYGAVSEQTARAMARGVRKICRSVIGVSVTGIAGPAGGTKKKPVGLVYMAVASDKTAVCLKCAFTGSRLLIKKQSADAALRMIYAFIR
jgi:PncC family amidohydrolase